MDNYKLRMKVGQHEFEAEGPKESVIEQFEAWKSLLNSTPNPHNSGVQNTQDMPPNPPSGSGLNLTPELSKLFTVDEKRDLITLRHLPIGEDRHRESILLTLYGYLRIRNQDEVLVTKLKSSLSAAGSAPGRIDRVADPYLREGLLVKGGSGKGGKYRLTNKGISKADELVRTIVGQL